MIMRLGDFGDNYPLTVTEFDSRSKKSGLNETVAVKVLPDKRVSISPAMDQSFILDSIRRS